MLLGADEVVSQLLELGFPSDLENAHGWTPLNEAIALGNREIVKIIYSFQKKHIIQVAQKSRKALQESFLRCPNFRMELSWKFTSMLLGPLLRRYAPSDVYTIWKCGERIRVDGTLRAADGIFDEEEEGAEEVRRRVPQLPPPIERGGASEAQGLCLLSLSVVFWHCRA